MAFTGKIKLEAKRRSAFRCCICEKSFVEIHHIIPQSEGGPDTIDNAAPLCASCHDLFGGNPEKRKQIREMRDHWWELIAERHRQIKTIPELNSVTVIKEIPENINQLRKKAAAIYHLIFSHENFETSAKILFSLVNEVQKKSPNQKRILFLDIEGHRNKNNGFDGDMYELQIHFISGFLLQYLSEAYLPLIAVKNKKCQNNDVPDGLQIFSQQVSDEINKTIEATDDYKIFSGEKGKWITINKT